MADHFEYDEETQEEILSAIHEAIGRRRGEMVQNVIVLATTIDPEGRNTIWTCSTPGMARWTEQRILLFAMDKVSHTSLIERLARMDEED